MSEMDGTPSFRDQAMARMAQERDEAPPQPAPENVEGTAPEVIDDEPIGTPEPEYTDDVIADDIEAQEEQDEDGTLEEELPDDVEHDWEKRYKDAQSELTRLQQNREEFESEMALQLTEVKRREFELDDILQESRGHAEILLRAMTGQADSYRNVDISQLTPEQHAVYQRESQAAFYQEQQVSQALETLKAQQKQAFDQRMQRESELALTRLRKTIPGWSNETYGALRDYAESRGLDPVLFNAVTNPAVIEMIHDSMQLRSAGGKAKSLSKRKSQKLANANSPTRIRDARGKFVSAKQAFEQSPNTRGSFAKMKEAQLAMEKR